MGTRGLLSEDSKVRLRPQYRQLGANAAIATYRPAVEDSPTLTGAFARVVAEQKYVPEIVESLKNHRPIIGGPRRVSALKGASLDDSSTREQVQSWLRDKGFSDYVLSLFIECSAADMFRLGRDDIVRHCGEEGTRLHSLLLVQKRRSNYGDTPTEPQLRALLKMRREYVDQNNEGDTTGEPTAAMIPEAKSATPPPSMASTPPTSEDRSSHSAAMSLLRHQRSGSSSGATGGMGDVVTPVAAPRTTMTRTVRMATIGALRSVDRKESGGARNENLVQSVRAYH